MKLTIFKLFQQLFDTFLKVNKVLNFYLNDALLLAEIDSRSNIFTAKVILKNVSIAFAILLYNLIRYLYFLLQPVDDYWRLVLYDITLFLECGQKWNIFNLGVCLQITYSMWRMYFKMINNKKMATPILVYQQILDGQQIEIFIKQKIFFRKHHIKVNLLIVKAVRIYTMLFSYSIPLFSRSFLSLNFFIFNQFLFCPSFLSDLLSLSISALHSAV